MSAPGPDLLDSARFGELFDAARHSVFRWEGRQTYDIPDHDPDLLAWRTGTPRAERSVRTSPWLRRIAVQTARDVEWTRLRGIAYPLTEYTRYELVAYVESQATGEQIRLTDHLLAVDDFWLIDAGTPHAVAVWMRYDEDGRLLGRERVADPGTLRDLAVARDRAWAGGVPLNVWLAEAANA